MKRILWLVLLLAIAVFGSKLFEATDVARLQPVEVIRLSAQGDLLCVETDTGQSGMGETLAAAFENLKATSSGDIFLDTADYLILTKQTAVMAGEMMNYMRPACRVCVESGVADLTVVANYLNSHEPTLSLMQCCGEMRELPVLKTQEGRMELVS